MTDPSRVLAERVYLVTGAGSGIGRAIALDIAEQGGSVVVADIDPAGAAETVAMVVDAGSAAIACHCDIADPAAAPAAIESATEHFGRLDGAVNNAGITTGNHPLVETPDQNWHAALSINLSGTFFMLRAQLAHFRRNGGGAIVNMASLTALSPVEGVTAYAVSKAGVATLTRQAALENVDHGIRVNSVAPGVVRTPIFDQTSPERMARYREMQPGGRLAEPSEIATVTTFLLSDRASYVTGQVMAVDMGAAVF